MPAHDDGGTVAERFTAMMFLSSEVERLQAQVDADDALMLEVEGFIRCGPGTELDVVVANRCDEARARQESKR